MLLCDSSKFFFQFLGVYVVFHLKSFCLCWHFFHSWFKCVEFICQISDFFFLFVEFLFEIFNNLELRINSILTWFRMSQLVSKLPDLFIFFSSKCLIVVLKIFFLFCHRQKFAAESLEFIIGSCDSLVYSFLSILIFSPLKFHKLS